MKHSTEWVYRGVWATLSRCFAIPSSPPTLPSTPGALIRTFHPSHRYLSYLKAYFWIAAIVSDVLILAGWIILYTQNQTLAWFLAAPAIAVAVLPDIVVYVAVHLKYDTMWYVMTERSLHLRRGIWEILEHTITFENVQDVYIERGPIQQLFKISTIVVETAGATNHEGMNAHAAGNKAIMQGIENPEEICELVMSRVRSSRSTGLGDEEGTARRNVWTARQRALLRDIRDEITRRPDH